MLVHRKGHRLSGETNSSTSALMQRTGREATAHLTLLLVLHRYWGSQLRTPGQDFPSSPTTSQVGLTSQEHQLVLWATNHLTIWGSLIHIIKKRCFRATKSLELLNSSVALGPVARDTSKSTRVAKLPQWDTLGCWRISLSQVLTMQLVSTPQCEGPMSPVLH